MLTAVMLNVDHCLTCIWYRRIYVSGVASAPTSGDLFIVLVKQHTNLLFEMPRVRVQPSPRILEHRTCVDIERPKDWSTANCRKLVHIECISGSGQYPIYF
jgi:hypothetical protein